jgi:diacylglycerol kinase family enzyme
MITFVPASQVKVMADPDMVWTLDGERAEGGEVIEVENLHQAIRLIQRG